MTYTGTVEQELMTQELRRDRSIDSANIGVGFDRGAVTLSGHVASFAEKEAAAQAVKRVGDGTAVANQLKVCLSSSGQRDDAEIALDLARALASTRHVPRGSVRATVRNGRVTLTGKVRWDFQRRSAAKLALETRGVRGVLSEVALIPAETAADVERDIRGALHRSAGTDANQVHVTVRNSVATLTGHVSSRGEVAVARRAAASAQGVYEVKVDLRIEPGVPAGLRTAKPRGECPT